MLKSNRILCVVLVCTVSGLAYARAVKVLSFRAQNGENPTADGVAILNYNGGGDVTEVQVSMTDLTPHTHYEVNVEPGGMMLYGVDTNETGCGTAHDSYAGDLLITTGCATITIFLDLNGNWELDAGDEIRALGTSCR